jgi:serine protease inhibitor
VKAFHGVKSNILVEMMLQKSVQNYGQFVTYAGESFEIMKMGYRESQMHIIFVLPEKTEHLSNVFKYLTQFEVRKLSELLERLEPTELEILIPKMKVSTRVGIQAALEQVDSVYFKD